MQARGCQNDRSALRVNATDWFFYFEMKEDPTHSKNRKRQFR